MTFEELNIVRTLKKRIADEEQKLQGFRELAQSITPQFSRTTYREGKKEISYTHLDTQPKGTSQDSRVEMTVALIVDTEKIISDLKSQLEKETPLLIKKIAENFSDSTEQKILFQRYVVGKSFREIARMFNYSLRQIFRVHKKNFKKFFRDYDILNLEKICTKNFQKGRAENG